METIKYYKREELKQMTANRKQEFSALFQKLKKKKPKNLDSIVHALHQEAFDQFDCLDCANCCSGISPIVKDKDVERLAKSQRMKAADFISQYLYMDDDDDYVFQKPLALFYLWTTIAVFMKTAHELAANIRTPIANVSTKYSN